MSYVVFTQILDAAGRAIGTEANPLIFRSARDGAGAASETILSTSTNVIESIGDHIVVPAVAEKRIKVLALSVFSPGGAGLLRATFTDDLTGEPLFRVPVQAPADFMFSFGLAANTPSFLFATSPGKALNLYWNSTNQVLANLTYWMD